MQPSLQYVCHLQPTNLFQMSMVLWRRIWSIELLTMMDSIMNNDSVYFKLEEATRGKSYVNSIKPFQRNKDGRGAFLSLLHQYCGEDKWDSELKKVNLTLQTLKWRGQSNYPLKQLCQKSRNGFTTMRAAAKRVDFQMPNQHTRVGYLQGAIECDDAKLQAAIANIENDKVSKRVDFEAAVAFLLPSCPVSQKRQKTTKSMLVRSQQLQVEIPLLLLSMVLVRLVYTSGTINWLVQETLAESNTGAQEVAFFTRRQGRHCQEQSWVWE